MGTPYAFFEGKYVPLEEARVNVMTHAFLYGTAVFEGIRAYYGKESEELFVFRMREHYERFLSSCKILKITLTQSVDELMEITQEVLRRSDLHEDLYIRPVAYKSARRIGVRLDDQNDVVIFAVPMGAYLTRERPLKLMVSSWRRLEDNAIPARAKINGGYVNLALAANEAREAGFDEAILLNEDGSVSEAAGMNLFIIRKGVLITPPGTANVLEGITSDTLMTIARDLGITSVERTIDRSELYVADEVFLCGTGAEISAAASIDRRPIGNGEPGPITRKIQDVYFRAVRGEVERYRSWVTPIGKAVRVSQS